ncbi:PREDICTED: IAA-amino acid hydrolase [Prunus dulcis]|uniref:PREDICTED: IAA-amino acid hydrolase n=1 Tax=Prunus dulcis TaxID=3755 RepID=A0A5E4FGN9_PRUDU|nr:PREDICTED: IAA-amino acid hydrolase [Prunus dulcis]
MKLYWVLFCLLLSWVGFSEVCWSSWGCGPIVKIDGVVALGYSGGRTLGQEESHDPLGFRKSSSGLHQRPLGRYLSDPFCERGSEEDDVVKALVIPVKPLLRQGEMVENFEVLWTIPKEVICLCRLLACFKITKIEVSEVQVIESQAVVHRCNAYVDMKDEEFPPLPAVFNDESLHLHVKRVGKLMLGPENVMACEKLMEGEDFAIINKFGN